MKIQLVTLAILPLTVTAQLSDSITLSECFDRAVTNYPLYEQKELNNRASEYRISNFSSSWYPSVSLEGQATYQSDVIETSFFTAPHDQYKVYLDINQNLYDGGIARNRKNLENTNLEIIQKQLEIEFHTLKQQVSSTFFSIIMMRKNSELLRLMLDDLKEKHSTVEVSVKNGVLLPSDEQALRAEMLKLEQQADELVYKENSLSDILRELTGSNISAETRLIAPEVTGTEENIEPRPETALFGYQKSLIADGINIDKSLRQPKFFAFTQAGYGKPGLNMLNTSFDTYYLVGLGLKWNLVDWGVLRNKKKLADIQKQVVDMKTDNFNRNINIALQSELADINNYRDALTGDEEIISLRKKIADAAFAGLENGTVTSAEYLMKANDELQAKVQLEMHKILLKQSIINYQLIKGDI